LQIYKRQVTARLKACGATLTHTFTVFLQLHRSPDMGFIQYFSERSEHFFNHIGLTPLDKADNLHTFPPFLALEQIGLVAFLPASRKAIYQTEENCLVTSPFFGGFPFVYFFSSSDHRCTRSAHFPIYFCQSITCIKRHSARDHVFSEKYS
jgi:hypothetical protein